MKKILLLIAISVLSGCFDDADFHEGVNYKYRNGVLELLFTFNNGKFGNHYKFYQNGMIRSIHDTSYKYWIYDNNGNLTTTMYYKLLPNKTHYCKYFTMDSSCQLEYNDGIKTLKIKNRLVSFIDNSNCDSNEYALILKKDSIEIHGFTSSLNDIKLATYPLNE